MDPNHPESSPSHSTDQPAPAQPELTSSEPTSTEPPFTLKEERRPPSRGELLQAQYNFLETLFAASISALILLSLALNLFLFKQMRLARGQASAQRPEINKSVDRFQSNNEPVIRDFVAQLERFGATNANFRPILDKYRPWLGKYYKDQVTRSEALKPVRAQPSP